MSVFCLNVFTAECTVRHIPISQHTKITQITLCESKFHMHLPVIEGPDGNVTWSVLLRPTQPGGPYDITVKLGKRRIELTDILFGDIWFCSGQSNMAYSVGAVSSSSFSEFFWQHQLLSKRFLVTRQRVASVEFFTNNKIGNITKLGIAYQGKWFTWSARVTKWNSIAASYFVSYVCPLWKDFKCSLRISRIYLHR